jgi:hypothetical protein
VQELLEHPAVQGGLAPFVIALIATLLLRRVRLSGLAIVAGFAVTVYMVSGFAIEPLTTTRKLVWLGLASGLLALPLSLTNRSMWRTVIAALAAAAAVWMSLRILQQHATLEAVQWGLGGALYVGWLVYWMDDLRGSSVRAASAGMALGMGTGAAALIGASALLGQYGLSLGAAAAAYLLILVTSNSQPACGRSFTLPSALIAGLVGYLAVLTAQLPWYALPALAVVPLAGKLPVSTRAALWLQAALLSVATLACAAGAVYLSWRVNGAPPL